MKAFRIQANAIDTIYDGRTKEEALESYAKDAGYKSYEDLVSQHGEVDSAEEKPVKTQNFFAILKIYS